MRLQNVFQRVFIKLSNNIQGLIDFLFVVLQLLIFKVCGVIEISKIKFSNILGTERVKQNINPLMFGGNKRAAHT